MRTESILEFSDQEAIGNRQRTVLVDNWGCTLRVKWKVDEEVEVAKTDKSLKQFDNDGYYESPE